MTSFLECSLCTSLRIDSAFSFSLIHYFRDANVACAVLIHANTMKIYNLF